ncbi:MAG: hypothetical protein RQ899_11195 [Pseudomonadales bacterium]|nr:hypothetical protein [Pseudomonadales bacterium]
MEKSVDKNWALPPFVAPWPKAERWIFVFMAALIVTTVLVGFIPDSLGKIAAVQSGQRPPFSPVLHAHAVLMGAWVLLLLTQTSLVASNRRAVHQMLGLIAVVLMPAMVVTGFLLVPESFHSVWGLDPARVPGNVIAELKTLLSNLVLAQIRTGILFPIFVAWALMVRRKDPATHKRLMILATLLPLPAAIDRIAWLPHALPLSADLYMLLWALPMFAYDLHRYGRVPRAYVIWVAGNLPLAIPVYIFWGSPWWLATAPKLMGVE